MWKPGCLVIVEYINIVCWQTKAPIAHNFIHYPTIPNGLKALEAACRGPHRGVRKTPSQSMLASLMPMLLATGRNCRNWFIFFSTTNWNCQVQKRNPMAPVILCQQLCQGLEVTGKCSMSWSTRSSNQDLHTETYTRTTTGSFEVITSHFFLKISDVVNEGSDKALK